MSEEEEEGMEMIQRPKTGSIAILNAVEIRPS